jgi:hypothetical protein
MQDLATALCAFSSMRRLVKSDFLAEFLEEVAGKLPTFSTQALASVLAALGQLGYKPGDEWTQRVGCNKCDVSEGCWEGLWAWVDIAVQWLLMVAYLALMLGTSRVAPLLSLPGLASC